MKKLIFIIIALIMSVSLFAVGEHRIDMDRVIIDDYSTIENWSKINRNDLSINTEFVNIDFLNSTNFNRSLKWDAYLDRPRNSVVGIVKENLTLPAPWAIAFSIFPMKINTAFVCIEDTKGNRSFFFPEGLKNMQWNNIYIVISQLQPFAVGAPRIENVNKIFIGVKDGDGASGKYTMYISPIEYHYGAGTYYKNYSDEEINNMISAISAKRDIVAAKLAEMNSKGYPCRYQLSDLTVINQYIKEAKSESEGKKNRRAYMQLEYLDRLADQTINTLDEYAKDPSKIIDSPEQDMNKVFIKDGVCYAPLLGQTVKEAKPAFLTGFMGWMDPSEYSKFYDMEWTKDHQKSDYKVSRDYGFNATCYEWPMSVTHDKDAYNYYDQKTAAISDNNLAFWCLFSPHYVRPELYANYPSIDPMGYRQKQVITPYNVMSPDIRNEVAVHIGNIVPCLSKYPNLVGYDMENELFAGIFPDFDVNAYNAQNEIDKYDNNYTGQLEWTKHTMYDFMKFMREEVEKYDKKTPMFCKLLGYVEIPPYNREKISETLTAHGYYTYTDPVDRTEEYAFDMWVQSMILDSYRSFDPNKIIADGETHISYPTPENEIIPEKYMYFSLWNAYVRGKDMFGLWVYGSAIESIFNPFYCQPWAVEAAARASLDVNRLSEYVVPFGKQKGEYAVFYGGTGFEKLYQAMNFADTSFDLLTDAVIEKGVEGYKFIILLDDVTISENAMDILKNSGIKIIRIKSDNDKKEMWSELKSQINKFKCRKVNINTWGVESRSWTDGKNTYFYVANWNKDKKDIKVPKNCVDMISGNKVPEKITLESMDFYFLKF